jgi:flagellar biosynthesis protein FlgN
MTRSDIIKSLIFGIQMDVAHYAELQRLLEHQFQLLKARDTAAITALNHDHQTLVAKLQCSAGERSRQLNLLGIKPDDHGMTILLGQLPPVLKLRLKPIWNRLCKLLHQCQQQNEVNGRLLRCQYDVIQRMLHGEPSYDYAPQLFGGHNAGY